MILTVDTLINKIRELATKYPNAVYNSNLCFYHKGTVLNGPDTKGCIIGQAWQELDPESFGKYGSKSFSWVKGRTPKILEFLTTSWLTSVQQNQDSGKSWAECVKLADQSSVVQ